MTDPTGADREPGSHASPVAGAAEQPDGPLDFDPYRFGRPDHPVPPEYAPPGYVPPPQQQSPSGWPPSSPTGYPTQQGYPPAPGGQPGYPPPPGQQSGYPGGYQAYSGYGANPGYPPPPPGYGYGTAKTGNTKATVAMVLGILSIVFCWLSLFDLLLIVPAIVLGALGRGDSKRYPERGGRGPATAGLVCGLVAIVLAASLTVFAYSRVKTCIDSYNANSTAYNHCVRDRLLGGN